MLVKFQLDVGAWAIFEVPAQAQVKFLIEMWAHRGASASESSTGCGRVAHAVWAIFEVPAQSQV